MKSRNQELSSKMKSLLSLGLFNDCRSCGKVRESVKFEDLPKDSKKGFNELMNQEPYKIGATLLYCRKCDEYSILSNPFI